MIQGPIVDSKVQAGWRGILTVVRRTRGQGVVRSEVSCLPVSRQNLRSRREAGVGSGCGSLAAGFGNLDKLNNLEMGTVSDSVENWTPLETAEVPLF